MLNKDNKQKGKAYHFVIDTPRGDGKRITLSIESDNKLPGRRGHLVDNYVDSFVWLSRKCPSNKAKEGDSSGNKTHLDLDNISHWGDWIYRMGNTLAAVDHRQPSTQETILRTKMIREGIILAYARQCWEDSC